MSDRMRALRLDAPGQLSLVEVPVPAPGRDDVLVRIAAATICTSDLHDIERNPFGIALPRVLGHEAAGTVIAAGEHVRDVRRGQRVAIHPVVPCGRCRECLRGLRHHCVSMGHLGFDREGTFAEFVVQRADRVRAIPDAVAFEVGALLEPVCVSLQAVARAGELRGRTVLVVGDGPFGLLIARLARRVAGRVFVAGREPFRLQHVPESERILVGETGSAPASIRERVGDDGIDVAVLAVSSREALELAMSSLRPRGRLVVFSSLGRGEPVDLQRLHLRELEIVGACNDDERLDEALALLDVPALDLAGLVTHRIPFDEWPRAFELARSGHSQALKVALTFP
jgi:2-desacetyl-2-hydroxyethyl bacteriochlorophyllide A dehydrogenase